MGINLEIPLVVRLEGTNVDNAKQILKDSGLPIQSAVDLDDAAKKSYSSPEIICPKKYHPVSIKIILNNNIFMHFCAAVMCFSPPPFRYVKRSIKRMISIRK